MNAPTSERPRRSRAGLIVFLVFAVLIGNEVLEAVVPMGRWTLLGSLRGGDAEAPSDIAFVPLPYVNFGYRPDYARSGDVPKTTNARGFRGPDVAVPKPEGTYRIVCLGGSTTYSYLVADDETYPRHLEATLRRARPERAIEVVNAGVESYTSAESVANLAFRCLELQPDAIVIYHAANDYRPRQYANFEPSYFHYRKPWDGRLDRPSRGEGELRSGINPFVQRSPPEDNGDVAANVTRAGSDAFRRNLVTLCGIARAHGITPVLVSFAADPDPDLPGADPLMIGAIVEHNLVIRAVAEEQRAVFVDLDARLSRDGTFGDPVHLNAKGTEQKAAIIADALLEALF